MNERPGEMRVLVVDDEHLERQAIRLILDRAGLPFKVVGEARNGSQALQQVKELKPDIVLLDIKMPGMDGLTAAREIKKILPACAIVFLTAFNEFDYAQEALRVGAVDYLLKPVRTQELLDVLKEVRLQVLRGREEMGELKKLQEKLAEALPWLRLNLGLSLISGQWEEESALEQLALLAQLEMLPRVAFAVYMEKQPQEHEAVPARFELLRYRLQQLVEEALQHYPSGLCLPLSERMLIVLWGTQKPEPERYLQQLVKYIIEGASEKLSVGVTVGLGRFCQDIKQLPRSAWEAQTAAHLGMFYLGSERVVHIDELEQETHGDGGALAVKEKELISALRSGNREEVRSLFREFLGCFTGGQGTDLHLIKARLAGMLVVFSRSLGRSAERAEESVCTYNEFARLLALCHTVEELEEWLVKLAARSEKLFADGSGEAVTGVVKRALAYIHENYYREISLTDLSRVIYMNPDYFSRVFKKQVGCTFSEYVLNQRMEKAKELLTETDLPVGEVARKVGYPDPNYFSRVFSRTMGISPSRYRQVITGRRKI